MIRGKYCYIPAVLVAELNDIKREDGIETNIEAIRRLVHYAENGREVSRLMRLDWSKKRKITLVSEFQHFDGKPKPNPLASVYGVSR